MIPQPKFDKSYVPEYYVNPKNVINELRKHMLIDGFQFVLDIDKSAGAYFIDAATGKKYLDFFTCFASMPIGVNHPKLSDQTFLNYLAKISINKPSNSDIYTEAMASFVKTFFELAVPEKFSYSFFISGGALAVENALKAAFDWKIRKNWQKGIKGEIGTKIIHFLQAFHGRSGYTMSLTNTDPSKTDLYPKFPWPRIINPKIQFPLDNNNLEAVIKIEKKAIEEIKLAFFENKNDIAAIIIEPIQGEGGDNHFRPDFLQSLRQLSDENQSLLIFDEIQTGVGITGTMWAHEQLGVIPDIMTFGKKMQICGIIATDRLDEVPENVFHTSSRINSTWGGNLTDMVRATKYLEIIEEENLLSNVIIMGDYLIKNLIKLQNEFPQIISNARGRGLFCAFDVSDVTLRGQIIKNCFENGLFILPCGIKSIRFRPPLNITKELLEEGLSIVHKAILQSFK